MLYETHVGVLIIRVKIYLLYWKIFHKECDSSTKESVAINQEDRAAGTRWQ